MPTWLPSQDVHGPGSTETVTSRCVGLRTSIGMTRRSPGRVGDEDVGVGATPVALTASPALATVVPVVAALPAAVLVPVVVTLVVAAMPLPGGLVVPPMPRVHACHVSSSAENIGSHADSDSSTRDRTDSVMPVEPVTC